MSQRIPILDDDVTGLIKIHKRGGNLFLSPQV